MSRCKKTGRVGKGGLEKSEGMWDSKRTLSKECGNEKNGQPVSSICVPREQARVESEGGTPMLEVLKLEGGMQGLSYSCRAVAVIECPVMRQRSPHQT